MKPALLCLVVLLCASVAVACPPVAVQSFGVQAFSACPSVAVQSFAVAQPVQVQSFALATNVVQAQAVAFAPVQVQSVAVQAVCAQGGCARVQRAGLLRGRSRSVSRAVSVQRN